MCEKKTIYMCIYMYSLSYRYIYLSISVDRYVGPSDLPTSTILPLGVMGKNGVSILGLPTSRSRSLLSVAAAGWPVAFTNSLAATNAVSSRTWLQSIIGNRATCGEAHVKTNLADPPTSYRSLLGPPSPKLQKDTCLESVRLEKVPKICINCGPLHASHRDIEQQTTKTEKSIWHKQVLIFQSVLHSSKMFSSTFGGVARFEASRRL